MAATCASECAISSKPLALTTRYTRCGFAQAGLVGPGRLSELRCDNSGRRRHRRTLNQSEQNETNANHPTLPSRLIPNNFCASTANSIGSCCSTSRAKPLTISATASSWLRPRLIA